MHIAERPEAVALHCSSDVQAQEMKLPPRVQLCRHTGKFGSQVCACADAADSVIAIVRANTRMTSFFDVLPQSVRCRTIRNLQDRATE
jgi:hypothetical protein